MSQICVFALHSERLGATGTSRNKKAGTRRNTATHGCCMSIRSWWVAEVRPHPDSDYERMKKKISLLHSQALQGRVRQPFVHVSKSDYFT